MKLLRWRRMQAEWTRWMRANQRTTAAVPMLLESSERPAPPSALHKKRAAEERSPGEAEPASGAVQTPSPNTTGGKQPRTLTYAAAAGGGDGASSSISLASMTTGELKAELARRGLEATGLKAVMVARLQQALALPPPPPT